MLKAYEVLKTKKSYLKSVLCIYSLKKMGGVVYHKQNKFGRKNLNQRLHMILMGRKLQKKHQRNYLYVDQQDKNIVENNDTSDNLECSVIGLGGFL